MKIIIRKIITAIVLVAASRVQAQTNIVIKPPVIAADQTAEITWNAQTGAVYQVWSADSLTSAGAQGLQWIIRDANCASKGTNAEWDLTHRYMSVIGQFLQEGKWKPKGGCALITLVVKPAPDVSVTAAPDGKHFTVTAPSDHEPKEWDTKITKGLQKAGG